MITRQLRSKREADAYTLLELMLALALLGALMTVAWSLFGTFRDAEQRGWKLSHRVQTVRAARDWLQNDLQHLTQNGFDSNSSNSNGGNSTQASFSGTSLGFTATIAPSLDPLPFLQELMSDQLNNDDAPTLAAPITSLSPDNATPAIDDRSPWPQEALEIEYQLEPISDDSAIPTSPLNALDSIDSVQFTLTRRERIHLGSLQNFGTPASATRNPLDRVLTAQDLYRQTDETKQTAGSSIRESRLEGLTNVQFKYFDGQGWIQEWSNSGTVGLPKAVALCFDFPARAAMTPPKPPAVNPSIDGESNELLESNPTSSQLSFVDSVLAAEPVAEMQTTSNESLMVAGKHEVQIIVYVNSSPNTSNQAPLAGAFNEAVPVGRRGGAR